MNYKENTIQWKVGDIIIHDCDAKRENMLMKIIERRQNAAGQLIFTCAYIDKNYHINQKGFTDKQFNKWNKWENTRKSLHDPKRFNLNTKTKK